MAAGRNERSVYLYGADLKALLSRVRLDLGRELTVLIASGVLFATFFYVFNDFLNVQVSSLSGAMRDRFAAVAAAVVLMLAAAIAARSLRSERVEARSFTKMAVALGEEPGVVRLFVWMRGATVIAVVHGVAWWMVLKYLIAPETLGMKAAVECGMLVLTQGAALIPGAERSRNRRRDLSSEMAMGTAAAATQEATARATATYSMLGAFETAFGPVAAWRLRQLLFGSRPAKVCFALAGAFVALAAWAAFRAAPPFVAAAAALVAGMLAATALAFQMAEDLASAWTERAFGVSHDEFIAAYQKCGGLIAAAVAAGVFVVEAPFAGPIEALKAAAVGAVPPLVAPLLLLQIDGRRPAVNVMLIVIVGLFLGTAVFAHWLSLILLLALRHYALKTQAGRFYRA